MPTPTVRLFSYGTLQKRSVQVAKFGRELNGRADVLPGYVLRLVDIPDPGIVALSGEARHPNLEPSSKPDDEVAGMVFEITAAELTSADAYEAASSYERIEATLRSGLTAWVYIRRDSRPN